MTNPPSPLAWGSVINVRLPLEVKHDLERRARAAGVSVSDLVRDTLDAGRLGGVWLAYYPAHISAASAIPFATETEALRWALENGHGMMRVKRVAFGSDFYQGD